MKRDRKKALLLPLLLRSKKWYKPGGPRWELSPTEKANIALIASSEAREL